MSALPKLSKGRKEELPLAERIAAALGFALFAFVLGITLYQAFRGDRTPPDVVVRMEVVSATSEGFLVQFTAVNRGGSPAEGVIVEAQVLGADGSAERSHTTLDYLPGHSERRGGLFLTVDPRARSLRIRALGYQEP
jgi:uncharacterized protein (TIGR02588 family)